MTEENLSIFQKEDIDCELTILKQDGTPLNMSAGSTKIYIAILDGYGNIVAKFKKGGASFPWYSLDTGDLTNGVIAFKVLSEVTAELVPGKYYAEINIRYSSILHTDDNYYDVFPDALTYLFSIVESQINKLVSLP
jgi:hypothetical protein